MEILRDLLFCDALCVEEFLAGGKDLRWINGLGEIVIDLATDSFFHERLLLVLRDHDDRD